MSLSDVDIGLTNAPSGSLSDADIGLAPPVPVSNRPIPSIADLRAGLRQPMYTPLLQAAGGLATPVQTLQDTRPNVSQQDIDRWLSPGILMPTSSSPDPAVQWLRQKLAGSPSAQVAQPSRPGAPLVQGLESSAADLINSMSVLNTLQLPAFGGGPAAKAIASSFYGSQLLGGIPQQFVNAKDTLGRYIQGDPQATGAEVIHQIANTVLAPLIAKQLLESGVNRPTKLAGQGVVGEAVKPSGITSESVGANLTYADRGQIGAQGRPTSGLLNAPRQVPTEAPVKEGIPGQGFIVNAQGQVIPVEQGAGPRYEVAKEPYIGPEKQLPTSHREMPMGKFQVPGSKPPIISGVKNVVGQEGALPVTQEQIQQMHSGISPDLTDWERLTGGARFWLSKDGDFTKGTDHYVMAKQLIKDVNKVGTTDMAYNEMRKRGYIRIMVLPDGIHYEGQPTDKQLSLLKDFALEHGKKLFDQNGDIQLHSGLSFSQYPYSDEDLELFKKNQARFIAASQHPDSSEYMDSWRENERLKNKYHGNTPLQLNENLQEIRPAVRTMDNKLVIGQKGQVHNDIINEHKLAATDIDSRLFVGKNNQPISREQLNIMGVPATEAVPGAHANKLAEVQNAVQKPSTEEVHVQPTPGDSQKVEPGVSQPGEVTGARQEGTEKVEGERQIALGSGLQPPEKRQFVNAAEKLLLNPKMFDISKPAARLEAGEPMTMMGRMYSGVPVPDLDKVKDQLDKAAIPIANLLSRNQLSAAMSRKYDAIKGISKAVADQRANDIAEPLRREFKKDFHKADVAVGLIREVKEQRSLLEDQLSKAKSGALDALPKWKKEWTEGAQFALDNWNKLVPVSEHYQHITDQVLSKLAEADKPVERRSGYVRHLPEIEQNVGSFRHAREYDTFFDRIAAGSDPKTLSSTELLKSTIYDAQRTYIQSKAFNEWMEKTKLPGSDKPLAVTPKNYEKIVRGAGRATDVRPPSGYVERSVGGQRVAIAKEYANLIDRLTAMSFLDKSEMGKLLANYTGLAKHIVFAIDIVHLARIARREMFAKLGTGHLPAPTYKQGILTLDYTEAQLREKAKAGEIPKEKLDEILENRRVNNKLIEGGFNVGHYYDAIRQDWMRKLPVTGPTQRFIFDQFTRGAMAEVGPITYRLYKEQYPKLNEQQLIGKVVHDLNFQFANMGKQGWFKSASGQDVLRVFIAAPQWSEGTPRYEMQAVRGAMGGLATMAKNVVTKGPMAVAQDPSLRAFNIQSRTIGSMIAAAVVANQIINVATRGYSTFENKEEDHKLSAWVPTGKDTGYWIEPEATAMETAYRVEQVLGKSSTLPEAATAYVNPKLSTFGKTLATGLTGHKFGLTGPLIPSEDRTKATLEAAIPTPILGSSLAKGEETEQVLRSAGFEGEKAQTARQQMYQEVRKWKRQNNIPEQTGDFPESQYLGLNNALRKGDFDTAKQEYEALKTKMRRPEADKLIEEYYKNLPNRGFAGSAENEERFKQSLTPDKQQVYEQARQSNEDAKAKFFQLVGKPEPKSAKPKKGKKYHSIKLSE